MPAPASAGRRAAAALAACAAAAVVGLYARTSLEAGRRPFYQNEYRDMGLNIRAHGLMKDVSGPGPSARRMPLYPVLVGLVSAPGDRGRPLFWAQFLLGLLSLALVFEAARALGGPAAGALAAAAAGFDPRVRAACGEIGVECLFSFTVLAALCALVAWAARPTRRSAVLAGLALGACLLCRSTLLLVPPALAAAVFLARDLAGLRRTVRLLALCAALPLVPWAARNAVLLKGFVPFENYTAAPNVYAASVGGVDLPDPWAAVDDAQRSSGRDLRALSDLERGRALDRLALANVRSRPVRYAASTLLRLGAFWGWQGLLFIPILVWLLRRAGPAPAVAAAFVACFSAHALLALDAAGGSRYLVPALPALYAVAAAAVAGLAARAAPGPAPSRALGAAGAVLLLLAAGAAAVSAKETWTYGLRGVPAPAEDAQLADLEAESGFFPNEAKLDNDAGVVLLVLGRDERAEERLERAARLDPGSAEAAANLAQARRRLRR